MKKYQAGFSILELAIVLTVISLIVSASLAVAASRISAARVENTLTKTATLMELLNAYVKSFGHFPCPADPSARPEDANFGVGANDGVGNCTATSLLGQDNYVIGTVPTSTLGLMGSSGVDGWNRRFTYVIDRRFTFPAGYAATNPDADGDTYLTVLNAAGGAVNTNKAIMVLISHGANGHGSWRAKGGGARLEADPIPQADELENANDDGVFVARTGGEQFDDMVQYRLKWQIQ